MLWSYTLSTSAAKLKTNAISISINQLISKVLLEVCSTVLSEFKRPLLIPFNAGTQRPSAIY